MEYVTVKYPESRKVLVDGELTGVTNEILKLEEGTHTFELGGAKDYKPLSQTVVIEGTNPVKPMEVAFEKV